MTTPVPWVTVPQRFLTARNGRKSAADMIRAREPFDSGNLTGNRNVTGWSSNAGRLPERFFDDWTTATGEPHTFVVWSWATPIAWVKHDGTVVIPNTRYSVSTTKQQAWCHVLNEGN